MSLFKLNSQIVNILPSNISFFKSKMEVDTSPVCIVCCDQFQNVPEPLEDPSEIQEITDILNQMSIQAQNVKQIGHLVCADCFDSLKDAVRLQCILKDLERQMESIKRDLHGVVNSIAKKVREGDELSLRDKLWTEEYPKEVHGIREGITKFAEKWDQEDAPKTQVTTPSTEVTSPSTVETKPPVPKWRPLRSRSFQENRRKLVDSPPKASSCMVCLSSEKIALNTEKQVDKKLTMRPVVSLKRFTQGMIIAAQYKLKKRKSPSVLLFGDTSDEMESSLDSDEVEEESSHSDDNSSADSFVVYVRRKSELSLWCQKVVAALYGKQQFEKSQSEEKPKWSLKFNRKLNRLTYGRVPILLLEKNECLKCGKCRGDNEFLTERRPESYWEQITEHIKTAHLMEGEEEEDEDEGVEDKEVEDWEKDETWEGKTEGKPSPRRTRRRLFGGKGRETGDRINGCGKEEEKRRTGTINLRKRRKKPKIMNK